MRVTVFGCGKVGTALSALLKLNGYQAVLIDANHKNLDKVHKITGFKCFLASPGSISKDAFQELKKTEGVICALPFSETIKVVKIALRLNLNYVDLTEDVETALKIQEISSGAKTFFLPQVGLAPGLVSVYAKTIYREFNQLEAVRLKVGALPLYPSNALKYNLTWSTEGLLNEYIKDCYVIDQGEIKTVPALEGYETFAVEGVLYEAFYTSGGIGTLHQTLRGKAKEVNYKSIRYPGHRDYIKFLLHDLKFREKPADLCKILESSIPSTGQDKCLIFVEVIGHQNNALVQKVFHKTFYHKTLFGVNFSAIQLATAAGALASFDVALHSGKKGFLRVEDLDHSKILNHPVLKLIDS
ncbi:MAG: saccharopine dehydrogenase family protein [Deltaproteobacteria bacterium]|nr:saccharopine dehydrogenase family protein [Deltaproteobacteria bacterium]MCX7952264.1 saccharopine dehydrogenase family protein [Deltaproteobacteria bacterium]